MSKAAKTMKRVTAAINGASLDRQAILATAENLNARATAEFLAGAHERAEELRIEAACYARAAA